MSIEKARAAYAQYRQALKAEHERNGEMNTPSVKTAFFKGYLSGHSDSKATIDQLTQFIKDHVEHEIKLAKQIDFLKAEFAALDQKGGEK